MSFTAIRNQKQRARSARFDADQFQKQRFSQHNRSMLQQDQGSRHLESVAARQDAGGSLSEGDQTRWHSYVHKGGKKPGGFDGFGGEAPVMGEAPTLNVPEYDEDKVSALTQKRAAPGVKRLRDATQQAMGETYENPNVKKMTVRDALAGYGTGLENVMAGAGQAAAQEYGQQYAASVNAEMARYQGALNRQSQMFDVSSRSWLMERQAQIAEEHSSDPYESFNQFYM